MPSYVITGVSRGLGWEFLRQISANPNNQVIGLVRDKKATDKRVSEELAGRANINILQADISDYDAIKTAVAATSEITGGSLDYLIANAANVSKWDAYDPIGVLAENPKELEKQMINITTVNIVGNINLFKLYIPLLLKGQAKKVISLTTGHADLDSINQIDIEPAALYSISKAGMNIAVAKFSAQYKKDGILFFSLSPGVVDVGSQADATPEQLQKLGAMAAGFLRAYPEWKGPAQPEDSVRDMLAVIEKASIEDGFGGSFLSHHGDKHWL
ncbi:unnamed protein product [Clonostachys rosea f. rosea IK726]|uniref:Uncharacterized protein n=2 Tax=Bionectria ochroleuca TaxID=29856 RepID=A0A0B7KHN0_BIOOC|nr:unnamed protein product [Clonostachys rosea f. rosea IK726]